MTQTPQAQSSALNDAFLEAQNPALQQRVTVAIVYYANTVANEATDTPNHAARQRLAEQIVRQPSMFAQPFTLLVTSQGFNAQGDDGVLRDWVTQVWNTMAGSSSM